MPAAVIAVDHVSRTYRVGDVDVRALDDVDLRVEAGERLWRPRG